jgi:hypothetical protein
MAVFLPGYTWISNSRNGGGEYMTPGPSSILLHMTVSMGVSAGYIAGHPYPPHLWANPYNGDRFQTVTLDRSAFALYQPDYGNSWTNRKGYTLQTECVGVPEVSIATWTDAQCKWLGEQVVAPQATWLASVGRPVNLDQVRYHQETGGSASEYWAGRMSEGEWDAFNGLLAHIDVPYNDHWDCSAERLDVIAAYARAAIGQGPGPKPPTPPPEEEDDTMPGIQLLSDPKQGGNGTVYGAWGPELWAFSDDAIRQAMEATGTLKKGIAPVHPATINGYVFRGIIEKDTYTLETGAGPTLADVGGAVNAGRTEMAQHTASVHDHLTSNLDKLTAGHAQIMATQGSGTVAPPPPPPTVKEVLVKATDQELYMEIARRASLPRATGADVGPSNEPTEGPPS